jgi:cytochrome P450
VGVNVAPSVDTNPRDQIGRGYGVHRCAGIHLVRLELESLLRALVLHVDRVETAEPPQFRNNILQGFNRLKLRLD